ncbi:MAG: efflux RND transporter periplasmic adaptor subunit [Gemmatimonadetes bacterium]|nr:efflux RND transporter periplasmic adaptor subunit [Gemmatimonadota bacterium]
MLKHRRTWIGAVVAMLAVGVGTWVAGCRPADGETANEQTTAETARTVNVEVVAVAPGPFVEYIRATGEVEALSDVTLSAEESGVVREFYVAKGAWVRQGEAIAKIDDAVLKAQVEEARAATRLAQEQYDRQRRVWEESKVGSEIGLLQSRSQSEAAAARLAALESRLERTVIRSPVSGVFDEKDIEVGEMAMPGARVGRVVATHRLKVSAGMPERFAPDLKRGAAARITFDVFPGREFQGAVGFVGSTVDPENRTFPVEILLDNPQRLIKPRMVANVQVMRARLDNVIVVPQDVVVRTEAGYQVFVVAERDGKLVALPGLESFKVAYIAAVWGI